MKKFNVYHQCLRENKIVNVNYFNHTPFNTYFELIDGLVLGERLELFRTFYITREN